MNFIKRLFTPRVESEAVKITKAILREADFSVNQTNITDEELIKKIDLIFSTRLYPGIKYSYEEYFINVDNDFVKINLTLNSRTKVIIIQVRIKPNLLPTTAWSEFISSREHKELIKWAESLKLTKNQINDRISNKKQEEARQAARRVLGILEENT